MMASGQLRTSPRPLSSPHFCSVLHIPWTSFAPRKYSPESLHMVCRWPHVPKSAKIGWFGPTTDMKSGLSRKGHKKGRIQGQPGPIWFLCLNHSSYQVSKAFWPQTQWVWSCPTAPRCLPASKSARPPTWVSCSNAICSASTWRRELKFVLFVS